VNLWDPSQMYTRLAIVVRMRLKARVQSDRIDSRGQNRGVNGVTGSANTVPIANLRFTYRGCSESAAPKLLALVVENLSLPCVLGPPSTRLLPSNAI